MSVRFEDEWLGYVREVMPADVSTVQYQETRRAFYAGGWALLSLIQRMLSPGAEPTAEDLLNMQMLHTEFLAFTRDVTEGRA